MKRPIKCIVVGCEEDATMSAGRASDSHSLDIGLCDEHRDFFERAGVPPMGILESLLGKELDMTSDAGEQA